MMPTLLMTLLSILPAAAQAQQAEGLSKGIVGSYRLVTAEGRSADGRVTYDWGPEPLGRLMLDADGHMSVHLLKPNRRHFASGDFLRPTTEEAEEAIVGYFGYFGSYTLDESAGVLTFHVDGAAYPNYIGTDQRRFFDFDGTRLTLRTPPERAGGAEITYVIIFERERPRERIDMEEASSKGMDQTKPAARTGCAGFAGYAQR